MKRILSFILAFLLLSSLFSVGLSADEFEEPDVDLGVGFGKFFENYGYEYLEGIENGSNLQDLYDAIDTKALLFDLGYNNELGEGYELATFTLSKYKVSREEAERVWQIYKNDNPLYYWLAKEAVITDTSITVTVQPEYASVSTRSKYAKDINNALERIIGSTAGVWVEYKVALAYHDALLEDVEFAYASDGATPSSDFASNSILGAFSTGSGTSIAYAKALQLLLDYSEVESVFVTGKRDGVPHAWNIVKFDDGEWYWVDITVAEENPEISAFGLTEEEFMALPYEYEYNLPTGVGEEYLYELPERAHGEPVGASSVVGQILSYDCKSSATITLSQNGEVLYEITLDASGKTGLNMREFTFEDVEDGIYDLTVKVDRHLSFTVSGVVVDGEDVDLTTNARDEISTITLVAGDVNSDGCVDLKDVTALTSSNTYGKTYDDAETKSADINGDDCFDLKDLTIITSDKNYGKASVVVDY